MATPNYAYEKRQKELARKRKQEEKRQKKQTPGGRPETGEPVSETGETPAAPPPAEG